MIIESQPDKTPYAASVKAQGGRTVIANSSSATQLSREYLSNRLTTRDGSIGVFKVHESGFHPSGFGPSKR